MSQGNTVETAILRKLEEYGDSLIEVQPKKKRRRKETEFIDKHSGSHLNSSVNDSNTNSMCKDINMSRRKRKRLKKKLRKTCTGSGFPQTENNDAELSDAGSDADEASADISVQNRQLKLLSEELGLGKFKQQLLVNTQSSETVKKSKIKEPEIIMFHTHKRKVKKESKEEIQGGKTKVEKIPAQREDLEFNLEKARFEVQKFGIKGFHGNKKDEAMTALLIKLGAKPPKNKHMNYTEFQESRKQAILEEKQNREKERKLGHDVKKTRDRGRKRRDKNDLGELDGQVGRWKSGVQFIKKTELKGLKKSKIKM